MLITGSAAVIFLSMSTVTNAILQGINHMNVPVRNAFISLILHIGVLYLMLMVFKMGIYSMVFANIAFAVFMCILNAIAIRRYLNYRQEIVKTFLLPARCISFYGGGGIRSIQGRDPDYKKQFAWNYIRRSGGNCRVRGAVNQAALRR